MASSVKRCGRMGIVRNLDHGTVIVNADVKLPQMCFMAKMSHRSLERGWDNEAIVAAVLVLGYAQLVQKTWMRKEQGAKGCVVGYGGLLLPRF